jgi:ribosomal protein S18 acetylase RimI-like enzyme
MTSQPRSLGLRTDLMLRAFSGQITYRSDGISVRTPSNPTFRWGNYMVFPSPPKPGDVSAWTTAFRAHVGRLPDIAHLAFTWDSPDGDEGAVAQFVDRGFERFRVWVMTAKTLRDPRTVNNECELRSLAGDADFDAVINLLVAQNAALPEEEREGAGYEEFARRHVGDLRQMVEAGWGAWFGAFIEGRLASSLGVFVRDGLGRFQMVDTHPQFRRKGLAGTLLVHAGRYAQRELGAEHLVITADADDVAKDLYASVGFTTTERLTELTLADATAFP